MEQFYTVRQVVHFAIALEQAAQQFYRRLAESAPDEAVKQYLQELVREETLHEDALRNAIDAQDQQFPPAISAEDIDAYIQAVKVPDPLDYKKAVRMACDKEKASRMLYAFMASGTDNAVLRDLFRFLETQEAEHQASFEKIYDRIRIGQN